MAVPGRSIPEIRTSLATIACLAAGSPSLLVDARAGLLDAGVIAAVDRHDDGPVFDWLMETVSYRGIADTIALAYMDAHGRIGGAGSTAWPVSSGDLRFGRCAASRPIPRR